MPLAIILIAITLSGTFIAGIFASFTRETTGMFERWNGRTVEERQAFFDAANQIAVDPNSTDRSDPAASSGDDDGDGLDSGSELSQGLNPRNPDTDGDGTADGIEILLGTDPQDPSSGGLGPIILRPSPPLPSGQLTLDTISKSVDGDHLVSAAVGSSVTFTITASAHLQGDLNKTLVIEDRLPGRLRFQTGHIIFNGIHQDIASWTGRQQFSLDHPGNYSLVFSFTAEVIAPGTIENRATIFEGENPLNRLSDVAFVRATAAGIPPTSPPPLISFSKLGRTSPASDWHGVVFGETGNTVEFKIALENTQPNLTLTDQLPIGLDYIENSLQVTFNGTPQEATGNLFESGLTLADSGEYEIRFSVRVSKNDRFILPNLAKLTGLPDGHRFAMATVINRPD